MTEQERQDLYEALKDAFPSADALGLLANLHLRDAVAHIPAQANLSTQIITLIEWADANERITDLIAGARAENPQNKTLAAFSEKWGTRVADAGGQPSFSTSARRSVIPSDPDALIGLMQIGLIWLTFLLAMLFVAYLVAVEKAPWWAIPTMIGLLPLSLGVRTLRRATVHA